MAPQNVGNFYLRNEFQKVERCPEFFKGTQEHRPVESCRWIRSWAGAELLLSGHCDWGTVHAPYHLFGQPPDGSKELGWVRGSTVEASKAEYQSFVRDQKQLERISTRSCPDVGNILCSWSSQSGFRARRHLYQVGNV